MHIDLKTGTVQILEPDGTPAGPGFITADGKWIVTSVGVVAYAGAGPGDYLTILFPDRKKTCQAQILPDYWRPPAAPDVAVLRPQEPLPKSQCPQKREIPAPPGWLHRALGGLAGALLVVSLLALWALYSAHQARSELQPAVSRELAMAALNNLEVDPELSILLAMEAVRTAHTFEAEDALRQALLASHVRARLPGYGDVLALNSDRHWLVVRGCPGPTLQVWDISAVLNGQATTGQPVAAIYEPESLSSVAFSPDDQWITATSDRGEAYVWQIDSGRRLAVLGKGEDTPLPDALSLDGQRVALASPDGSARVWQLLSRPGPEQPVASQELSLLSVPDSQFFSISFSSDGQRVLTVSYDDIARVWQADTGDMLVALEPEGGIYSAAISPDGQRVATASGGDRPVRIWEVATGQELISLQGHAGRFDLIAFSPDGNRLVIAGWNGAAQMWDVSAILDDGELAVQASTPLQGHEDNINSVAFSPDGEWIVTASDDGTARVWQADGGYQLTVLHGHQGPVGAAAFSADGEWVATIGYDHTIRVWQVGGDVEVAALRDHAGLYFTGRRSIWSGVLSIDFSPDGRLATAGMDGITRIWQTDTGQLLTEIGEADHRGWILSVAFGPDGQRVVTASYGGTVQVWQADTGQPVWRVQGHEGPVYQAAFSPDGRWVVTASDDGTARVWQADTGQERAVLRGHESGVYFAAFTPDGRWVVTTGADHTARVWGVSAVLEPGASGTSAQVAISEVRAFPHYTGGFQSVVIGPDGQRIITNPGDCTARVWDISTGRQLAVFDGEGRDMSKVAFSPDGRRIFTVSGDTAQVWDADTGWQIATMRGLLSDSGSTSVRGLAIDFSPDGRLVVAAWGNAARVWQVETGRLVSVLRGHAGGIHSVAFSPDGRWIATASDDGTARIYAVHIQDLMSLAQKRIARELTCQEQVEYLHQEQDCQ